MERWVGKIALVTGASSGIGAAIVEEFVKGGLKVVGVARRVERIEGLKEKLKNEKGDLIPFKVDIGIEEEIVKLFEFLKEDFGTIHVLVNNAGISRGGKVFNGAMEDFKDIININLVAAISLSQKTIQLMKTTGVHDGHIIIMNSICGHYVPIVAGYDVTVYSASKKGLLGLAEGIRIELAALNLKTKISSISPGYVYTEIGQAAFRETKGTKHPVPPTLAAQFSNGPKLLPKDIADAVLYVIQTPPHVQIHDLIIRPVGEPF